MYNDDSLFIASKKYCFTSLKNVPAKYLLNVLKSTQDENLKEYISFNYEKLVKRAVVEKDLTKTKIILRCEKISYNTERDAMKEIIRIMKNKQENKKPIRVYKCDCGSYHLTSKEFH